MWLYVPESWHDEYTDAINVLDGCAGSGMFGFAVCEALRSFGFHARTLVHVEREAATAAACVGLEKAAGGEAAVWDDLATFDGVPWRGIIDVACTGLPCPAFSVAGKLAGNKDRRAWGAAFIPGRRHTWGPQPHWLRILAEVRPRLAFFENVPEWVSAGHFAPVGEVLHRLGYTIAEPVFLASEDVGAPHVRERVFILAYAGCEYRDIFKRAIRRQSERSGEQMGDTEYLRTQAGTQGKQEATRQRRCRFADAGDGLGLYPPGRNEYDKWDQVAKLDPSAMPAIESGVPVVADGLAFSNADLLRIGGNGVDPLVAALACRILFGRVFDWKV